MRYVLGRQPAPWVVITEPETRSAVGQFCRRAVREYLASPRSAAKLIRDDPTAAVQKRVEDSAAYLCEHMGEVLVLVIPCLRLALAQLPEGSQAGLWGSLQLLPAVWSYMLAARTRGLGTAGPRSICARAGDRRSAWPARRRPAGALVSTAYYTGETFWPAPRKPLDEVLRPEPLVTRIHQRRSHPRPPYGHATTPAAEAA